MRKNIERDKESRPPIKKQYFTPTVYKTASNTPNYIRTMYIFSYNINVEALLFSRL